DDITERKNAERKNAERKKQLEKLNITKDKFFSIIAHDLKNPMANLVSFVDLLLEDYDCFDDVERKNIIEVLYTDASRTLSLLENLLGWSLAQSGGLQADPEKLDISEIVTENIKLFFVSAGKKNIKVVNNIPNLQEVFADRKMVDAVIRNLLSNAIKFTENGTISFSSVVKGEKLQISVVDTGRGMKKKVVDNLFKIEESNSQDGTYGEKGTGIGLHLVKEFLKLNSGEISVESTPEKGSTFTVSLPL
ncbi:MAG: HAMP domain-containing sensor histidine kinase, partial [Bacteroidota bacterium]|nr:HAMP domain-containing sensor histidine kinase [Bacteroidota bacterium]